MGQATQEEIEEALFESSGGSGSSTAVSHGDDRDDDPDYQAMQPD
jgi:hypothetical protein